MLWTVNMILLVLTRLKSKDMTREQIVEKLKNMTVGGDILPIKFFNVITPNPDYDPDTFDKELDGIAVADYICPPDVNGDVFRVTHLTSEGLGKANEWRKNHSKICPLKYWAGIFLAPCINWEDGTRNYYSEEYVDKIIDFCEQYGGVIDFC